MWSRLAKVATDLAQDLAQPEGGEEEEDYDDDEDYNHKEGVEGDGWAEEDGDEHYGLNGGTPSATSWEQQQQQQHYDEGAEHHDEGEMHQEEEVEMYQEEAGEQPYEGEEQQQQLDEYDEGHVEGDDNNGWGDEEEVEFSMQGENQQQPAEEEPQGVYDFLAGNAHEGVLEQQELQQHTFNQEEAAGADDWDLDDEDLFEEGENQSETQQQQQQEEPISEPISEQGQIEATPDSNAIDAVEDITAEPEQNEWGNDDSLDFDDSHVQEEEAPAETYGADVASHEHYDDPRLQQDVADLNPEPSADQHFAVEDGDGADNTMGEKLIESGDNDWGNDDSLNFDDSRAQEEETPAEWEQEGAITEAPQLSHDNADQHYPEEDILSDAWGEEDIALNDSLEQPDNNSTEGDEIIAGEEAHEMETTLGQPPSQDTFDTAEENQEDAWNDDLAFDSDNNDDDANQGQDATDFGEAATSELIGQASHETFDTAEQEPQQPPQDETDVIAEEEGSAWNDDHAANYDDDDDNHNHTDAVAEVQPQVPDTVKHDTGDAGAWGSDDLNFSDHHDADDNAGLDDAEAQETDEGGGWGDDDLNLSSHQEGGELPAEPPSLDFAEGSANESAGLAQLQPSDGDVLETEGADAWDDDDLNLSAHDEEDKPPTPQAESQGEDQNETEENAWDNSGLLMDDDWPGSSTEVNQVPQQSSSISPPDDATKSSLENVILDANQESELQVFEDDPPENPWNDSDPHHFDGEETEQIEHAEEEQGEDDSTVEQSNIGFEQSVEELRTRRATIRTTNTPSASFSRKASEEGSDTISAKILGTSVTFTEISVTTKNPDEQSTDRPIPTATTSNDAAEQDDVVKDDGGSVSAIQDAVSTVSDLSAEIPKPSFETQISMLTLKSIADSCPSSRQKSNDDSDEDDEGGYGPVVDKTPALSEDPGSIPELSTMTINSTAVAAHSVNEDIQRDDDMDGTFYGDSAAGEAQSNQNAWEEDDASSLGAVSEKIVSFEMSADATAQNNVVASIQEETTDLTPQLDSSMANLYADDTSVPSRDKDDDNEDEYKPVVDQIPKPRNNLVTEKSGRTLNSMAVLADDADEDGKHEESGTHSDSAGGDENGWDDGASLEDLDSQQETDDQERAASASEAASRVVIENTPNEACSTSGKSDGSVAAVESVENSCPSREHDSDEEVYGLVVDQIPASPPPLLDQMSVAASSMAVVVNNVEEDLKQDEELDASDRDGSVGDVIDVNSEVTDEIADLPDGYTARSDRVVDLTPKMELKKLSRLSSNSLAVLAHSINQDFADDDEDEEDDANFGPIVDITPTPQLPLAMTPSSTTAQATNTMEETKQDETTEGGIGDVDWDDECPELEDMELGEGEEDETESEVQVDGDLQPAIRSGAARLNQVVLVDHTPEGDTHRKLKGDASLAVLAPSEDGSCLSINDDDGDADTIDPQGERISYGPVVDITPTLPSVSAGAPSTAPSVTFSLAVEARSVDEDFKLDDEMDETFCGDATLEGGGENAWEDDQTLEELETEEPQSHLLEPPSNGINSEPEVMVDHTPEVSSPQPRMGDASLIALAPSQADTYRSVDDSDNDDDTITHEEDLYGKVVDHTPRLAPLPLIKSTSMAVGASSADYRSEMEKDEEMDATSFGGSGDDLDDSGWGDDEQALEDIDTSQQPVIDQSPGENMVDHTPEAEEQSTLLNTDPSLAVLAPSEDGSREEDDSDTINDTINVYGPVVDVTPELPDASTVVSSSVAARHDDGDLEGTLFGDSTVGGDPGWDDDDAILDDLVDDEKDTEAVEASSHMEGSTIGKSFTDATSSQDGVILVDHTPSEIDSSAQKNSVGWLANVESGISGVSGDETEDVGVSWRDNDTLDPPNEPAEEDQVVDRIPQRPESRFGDASTLVVADPSEVLSRVGDMLQEEGDFGPVVDLTPPTRPLNPLTATGSMAVVAPTVVLDDLDDADPDPDDAANAEEEDGWGQDQSEQAPNPQSGNEDEAARVREQVVDFLPPQEEEPATDQNQDGWSEMSEVATGGAPSVLQADPKEDEFGPVVDQLPLPHPSSAPYSAAISTTSQVAPSECDAMAVEDETEDGSKQESSTANMVVDPLPRPFEVAVQNLDSTASIAHSLASEDEDDDGKYGLVVDHLPSIISSLPPSRGGSTVDALATVSEVIDDDDDDDEGEGSSSGAGGGDDGWGDDDLGEIDLSERHEAESLPSSNLTMALSEPRDTTGDQNSGQGDRGMTVRFRSVVAAIFESGDASSLPEANDSQDQDQQAAPDETDIFHDDVDVGESNAWDDDLDFDVSLNMDTSRATGGEDIDRSILSSPERYAEFAEADTPPATPYSRDKPSHQERNGIPHAAGVALPDLSFSPAIASMQCNTCANASTIDCPCVQRILKNKEEGDDTIKIDYNKLLQTEISKRRLVEEESNDLRSRLDTLKNSRTVGEFQEETVHTLQEHVKVIEDKLRDAGSDCAKLGNKNQELQSSFNGASAALTKWEERQKEWVNKEALLREEVEKTRRELEMSLTETGANQQAQEHELFAEAKKRQEEASRLSHRIEELQTECSTLQDENALLASDLQPLKQALAERDNSIESLVDKEANCQVEINRLSDAIQELESANASQEDWQQKYAAMEFELTSKESACEKLNNDVMSLQQRAQAAEGEQYRQMTDQARLTKQHEEEMTRSQGDVAAARADLEETRNAFDTESAESSKRQEEFESEVNRLNSEKGSLEQTLREVQSSGNYAMADLHSGLDHKEMELQAANQQLSSTQAENASLAREMERLGSFAQQTEQLEGQLRSVHGERDTLLNSLRDSNEQITRLQQQIEDQGIEEGALEASKSREIGSLLSERTNLQNIIIENKTQIDALEQKLGRLEDEKQTLESETTNLRSACDDIRASADSARLVVEREATDRSELSKDLEALKQEMANLTNEREAAQQELDVAFLKTEELEYSLQSAEQESESNSIRVNELDGALTVAQSQIASLQEGNDAITRERDQYLDKCKQLEQMLPSTSQPSRESSELIQVQQEFNDQSILLQNFEVRMNALENELSTERASSTTKEDTITGLTRHLELTLASLEESTEGSNLLPRRIAELEAAVSRLEGERSDLGQNLALLASKEQEFHNVCESLSHDRDTALNERDDLVTDNEEMLVQFGLLNEQIESYQEQIQELREVAQRYERPSEAAEAQLLDLQQRLVSAENKKIENGEHHVSRSLEQDREIEDLRNQQSDKSYQIEELTNSNAEKDAAIREITSELESVRNQLQTLAEVNAQSASMASENEALCATISDLELQRSQLESKLYDQSSEFSQLQTDFDGAQNASSALEAQVGVLEEACSDRDQALQQKETEMRELVQQLHETSGHSSETTQEILGLRDRLNQMESNARESSSRMHELTGTYERSQTEHESTRAYVSTLEASVEELEQELMSKEEGARMLSDGQAGRAFEHENELQSKAKQIADLTQQYSLLSTELDTVRSDLEAERNHTSAQADLTTSGEVESLRAQLTSMQEQLQASSAHSSDREQSLQAELGNLKRSLASKDGEVVMFKHKIQTLSKDVKESHDQIEYKQNDLEKVTKEKDELQSQQRNKQTAGSTVAAQLLQQTKENADDVDNLRSTVITLASALETSESRRADAIDRLLRERETYSNSLRHLSDSVKRFYNTLSFSES